MEPNNTNPQNTNKPVNDDLHAEGIDIVSGSERSEENEFSSEEPGHALPGEISVDEPPVAKTSVPVPPPVPQIKQAPLIPKPSAPSNPPAQTTSFTPRVSMTFDQAPKPVTPAPAQNDPAVPVAPVVEIQNDPSIKPLRTFKTDSESILGSKAPAPQPKPVTPAPTPIPLTREQEKPKNNPVTKPIRTFKTDAEETVKNKNVSVVSIAVAEQKKREDLGIQEFKGNEHSSTGIFVTSVLAIIVLLSGGWYYWFSTSQGNVTEQAPKQIQTIISYTKASRVSLGLDEDPLSVIATKLTSVDVGLGSIYALVPTESPTSTQALPIQSIIKDTRIPSKLSRSLSDTYMIGLYNYDVGSPFLILKDTFFQNAFAGMLEWERNIHNDLLPLIRVSYPNEPSTVLSTQTFEDAVVSNIDARVLKNDLGEVVLTYAFADKETIVITTSINSLKYILDRLLTVRTIQ